MLACASIQDDIGCEGRKRMGHPSFMLESKGAPPAVRLLASVYMLNAVSLILERCTIGPIERLPAIVLTGICVRRNCKRGHKAVAATGVIVGPYDLSRIID